MAFAPSRSISFADEADFAVDRPAKPAQRAHQRRLAGAVRPEHRDHLALRDRDRDVAQHVHRPVAGAQAVRREQLPSPRRAARRLARAIRAGALAEIGLEHRRIGGDLRAARLRRSSRRHRARPRGPTRPSRASCRARPGSPRCRSARARRAGARAARCRRRRARRPARRAAARAGASASARAISTRRLSTCGSAPASAVERPAIAHDRRAGFRRARGRRASRSGANIEAKPSRPPRSATSTLSITGMLANSCVVW